MLGAKLYTVQKVVCTFPEQRQFTHQTDMRWLFSILVLALVGFVQALSSSGSRLLIVVEEVAERAKYSTFWGDLEGLSILRHSNVR